MEKKRLKFSSPNNDITTNKFYGWNTLSPVRISIDHREKLIFEDLFHSLSLSHYFSLIRFSFFLFLYWPIMSPISFTLEISVNLDPSFKEIKWTKITGSITMWVEHLFTWPGVKYDWVARLLTKYLLTP